MIKVKEDLTGKTFGRLTVLRQAEDYVSPSGNRSAQWLCECSCTERNQVIIRATSLTGNVTRSCGCLRRELQFQRQKKYNQYSFNENIVIGKSLNTDDLFYVDLKNFDKIKDIGWDVVFSAGGVKRLAGYDCATQKMVLMHQWLGFRNCDHIDRNELNNLESNLRQCTVEQNSRNRKVQRRNTSGYSGVVWSKSAKKWEARIHINKKQTRIGYFDDKEDAIRARLQAEAKYYGEFAPQKHLFQQYNIISQKDGDTSE